MNLLAVVAYKPQVDKIHLLTLHVIIKSQVVNSIMLQLSWSKALTNSYVTCCTSISIG